MSVAAAAARRTYAGALPHGVPSLHARRHPLLTALLLVLLAAGCTPSADPAPGATATPSPEDDVAATPEADDAGAPTDGPADADGPWVGFVSDTLQRRQVGDVRVDMVRAEVRPEGVLVDVVAFNEGAEDVVLLADPTAVYASTIQGEPLQLDPPAELPVVLGPGATSELRLAFRGSLDERDAFVGVHLNHRDGEPLYPDGDGGVSVVFQVDLDRAGLTTATPHAAVGSTIDVDATQDRADVTVRVEAVEVEEDAVYVRLVATNRRTEAARLVGDAADVYLLDDDFRRYPVVPPAEDPTLELEPGEELTARLGFRGRLDPTVRELTLVLNHDDGFPPAGDPVVGLEFPRLVRFQDPA